MLLTTRRGLRIFQFDNLTSISWLRQVISTTDFGNVSLSVADDKQEITTNRERLFQLIETREQDVVETKQVQGNHVAIVGRDEKGHLILDTDALVTNKPRVPIFIKMADCVPILLVDTRQKIVAAVHAGWRGTASKITQLTIQHMEDHFGTDPRDVIAGIGPSIGPCCYEVRKDVLDVFHSIKKDYKQYFSKRENKIYLNLWQANALQLIESGVEEKNIEIAKICTFDNPSLFFSERREKPTGRFGALISLL